MSLLLLGMVVGLVGQSGSSEQKSTVFANLSSVETFWQTIGGILCAVDSSGGTKSACLSLLLAAHRLGASPDWPMRIHSTDYLTKAIELLESDRTCIGRNRLVGFTFLLSAYASVPARVVALLRQSGVKRSVVELAQQLTFSMAFAMAAPTRGLLDLKLGAQLAQAVDDS